LNGCGLCDRGKRFTGGVGHHVQVKKLRNLFYGVLITRHLFCRIRDYGKLVN
jgi:hypothetical protein